MCICYFEIDDNDIPKKDKLVINNFGIVVINSLNLYISKNVRSKGLKVLLIHFSSRPVYV